MWDWCSFNSVAVRLTSKKQQKWSKVPDFGPVLERSWKIVNKTKWSVLSYKIKCEIGTFSTASLFDRPKKGKKRIKRSRL
jgi:hypothetical protein